MGDAQFDGGGSVTWSINHSDGESCQRHRNGHGANGKDKCPRTEDGLFVVTVTGMEPIIVPVNGTTVRVIWGDPTDPQTAQAAKTLKATKSKAKKAKAAK